MASPGSERKKNGNLTSWFALKRPKTTSKKQTQKKKSSSLARTFFFAAFPNFFFSGHLANRFCLAELRGGRAIQKVDQAKTGAWTRPSSMLRGHGLAVTASGGCTRIMYAGRTEHPRSNRRGCPTNGVSDCLPRSWTAGPREELVPRIPDIFSWRFFFSNLQQENTRVCDSISRQLNRVRQF